MFSGGADKAVRMFDLATQQATQVGAHEAPVSCLKMVEVSGQQVCLTGSWDKVSGPVWVIARRRDCVLTLCGRLRRRSSTGTSPSRARLRSSASPFLNAAMVRSRLV